MSDINCKENGMDRQSSDKDMNNNLNSANITIGHIKSSSHQVIKSSSHQVIKSSSHQVIKSSSHQVIKSSSHQVII